MSDFFPLKISIWETSVNMLNADFSVFICKFFRFLSSLHFSLVNKPRMLLAPQELLQDVLKSKAREIAYDEIAVGSDGFAAVCRGEADDAGAGGAGRGQAME